MAEIKRFGYGHGSAENKMLQEQMDRCTERMEANMKKTELKKLNNMDTTEDVDEWFEMAAKMTEIKKQMKANHGIRHE